jgi:hypothetical protein
MTLSHNQIRTAYREVLLDFAKRDEAWSLDHLSQQTVLRADASRSSERRLRNEEETILLSLLSDSLRNGVVELSIVPRGAYATVLDLKFRTTHHGTKWIEADLYFFHDTRAYVDRVERELGELDDTTKRYVNEAVAAFRSNCTLACLVMIGCACESIFTNFIEAVQSDPRWQNAFSKVKPNEHVSKQLDEFVKGLDIIRKNEPNVLREVDDGLDLAVQSYHLLLRNYRNDAGHLRGQDYDLDTAFQLLQLFIPFAKKMHELSKVLV